MDGNRRQPRHDGGRCSQIRSTLSPLRRLPGLLGNGVPSRFTHLLAAERHRRSTWPCPPAPVVRDARQPPRRQISQTRFGQPARGWSSCHISSQIRGRLHTLRNASGHHNIKISRRLRTPRVVEGDNTVYSVSSPLLGLHHSLVELRVLPPRWYCRLVAHAVVARVAEGIVWTNTRPRSVTFRTLS